jgi:hypothetical protein
MATIEPHALHAASIDTLLKFKVPRSRFKVGSGKQL